MNIKYLIVLLATIVLTGTYACVNRYEIQAVTTGGLGYIILDRWTGEGCVVGSGGNGSVYICYDRSMKTLAKI